MPLFFFFIFSKIIAILLLKIRGEIKVIALCIVVEVSVAGRMILGVRWEIWSVIIYLSQGDNK